MMSGSMDPRGIQDKLEAFTQRLLDEANGDPVLALGLLLIVLDGSDAESTDHIWHLITEVRKLLFPDTFGEMRKPVQHFAGEVSWEGIQHCLRCGKVLIRDCQEGETALETGYAYEIGSRLTSEECDDFNTCI